MMNHEFEYSKKWFKFLQEIAAKHAGIALSDHKYEMVYGRLIKRLRKLKIKSFEEYCNILQKDVKKKEISAFINAITTNYTFFFREAHHFEYLAKYVLPYLLEHKQKSKKIRIWSAGCSTGEESYSLGIVVKEIVPDSWDVKILATDIDSEVLHQASYGVYSRDKIARLDARRIKNWFLIGAGHNVGYVRIKPEVQNLITFCQHNLTSKWPMQGLFDVIFCRNVVIYFNRETQKKVFDEFANFMEPQSFLFVGHSESLFGVSERFRLISKTVYKKIE